jgi:hypothetical protein
MPGPFNYVVFRDHYTSGAYHAVRVSDGAEIKSGTDAGPVLQAALDQQFWEDSSSGRGAGDIYVRSGLYQVGSSFSGLLLRRYTRVMLDPTAIIEVPAGYAGPVVWLQADTSAGALLQAEWDGGIIREGGDSASWGRGWTAFKLRSNPTGDPSATKGCGVMFNKISNTTVLGGAIGIAMYATGDPHSFVTSNKFDFLRFYQTKVTVDFQVFSGYALGEEAGGIHYNNFVDIQSEASHDPATYIMGIQNVTGVHNTFTAVNIWDVPTSPAMTIGSTADRTLVFGGVLGGETGAIQQKPGSRATTIIP